MGLAATVLTAQVQVTPGICSNWTEKRGRWLDASASIHCLIFLSDSSSPWKPFKGKPELYTDFGAYAHTVKNSL